MSLQEIKQFLKPDKAKVIILLLFSLSYLLLSYIIVLLIYSVNMAATSSCLYLWSSTAKGCVYDILGGKVNPTLANESLWMASIKCEETIQKASNALNIGLSKFHKILFLLSFGLGEPTNFIPSQPHKIVILLIAWYLLACGFVFIWKKLSKLKKISQKT
jgi:hypothetical protein